VTSGDAFQVKGPQVRRVEMGMAAAEAVHEEALTKVGQFKRLEKALLRRQPAQDLYILPVIWVGFGIEGHGTVI